MFFQVSSAIARLRQTDSLAHHAKFMPSDVAMATALRLTNN